MTITQGGKVEAKHNGWLADDAVCIYMPQLDFPPRWEDFARSAYAFLKALHPRPPDGKRVVIKPNAPGYEPDSGMITHPGFVEGIVEYFEEIGVEKDRMIIAEGVGDLDEAGNWRTSGYGAMAARKGVRLVNIHRDRVVAVPLVDGRIFKEVHIAETVKNEDTYLVNVPKLKTHNLAVTTLSMKNLQGTVVPPDERHFCDPGEGNRERRMEITESGLTLWEEVFCHKLCDLCSVLRPDLNIVEGIVGRDGTGFRRGKNIQTNLIVAGTNVVAVDTVASYLMGFDPRGIGYLKMAAERGLGRNNLEEIRLYEVRGGEVVPCDDLRKFISKTPFDIIRFAH